MRSSLQAEICQSTEKDTHSQRSCIISLKTTGRSEPSNTALLMLNLFDWQSDRLCMSSDRMSVSHRLTSRWSRKSNFAHPLLRNGPLEVSERQFSEEAWVKKWRDKAGILSTHQKCDSLANGFRNIVGVPEHILTFCFDKIHCIL